MKQENKKYTILLPQVEIHRTLPSNESKAKEYIAKTQEVRLYNFKNSYINSQAMVFSNFECMEETLPEGKKNFYDKQKLLIRLHFRSKIKKENLPVVVAADSFQIMYYHWLCDVLIRVLLAKKTLKTAFKIMLPKPYYDNNFCVSSLKMIGIEEDQIIVLDKRDIVKSSNVCFVSTVIGGGLVYTTYDSAVIELREEILKYCQINNKLNLNMGKRIFISRSRQKKRIILNRKELDKLLEKFGFVSVNMEDFDFADGVSIVYNANCIISQCGSNLTNIMFARKGTKVLELYPKKEYGDVSGGTWFSELSQACNLEHHYQYCEIDRDNVVINEFHTDMIVDLEQLEQKLKLFNL